MTGEHLEADRAADQLTRRPRPPSVPGSSVGDLGAVVGNRELARLVQRAAGQGAGPLDPGIAAEIEAARGSGRPLDAATRGDMETNLGADLSGVRVHTDATADRLSRSVAAEAFTTGTDVFFRSGTFAPGSSDGRRLLAHELTHVVQQGSGQATGAGTVSHPNDPHEQEARAVADEVVSASRPPADQVLAPVAPAEEADG